MRRSEINRLVLAAKRCFASHGWALPPRPKWDVTDFGLGDWRSHGLVLLNLAEEPEYCEKLMYAQHGMTTPAHKHIKKKEDIICRFGELMVTVWSTETSKASSRSLSLKMNGELVSVDSGQELRLEPGERVTLEPGVWHQFVPVSDECVIGEVSTANDDLHDNIFRNLDVGRFPEIEEDEPALVRLVGDPP